MVMALHDVFHVIWSNTASRIKVDQLVRRVAKHQEKDKTFNEIMKNIATLLMFKNQREAMKFNFLSLPPEIQVAQDLYGSETNPDFNQNEANTSFQFQSKKSKPRKNSSNIS